MEQFRLRALARYIRIGQPAHALFVAKHLPAEKVTVTLQQVLVEDIGLANIPLIDKLLPIKNIQSAVLAMTRSDKSQLAWHMRHYFWLPWSEPLPTAQAVLRNMIGEPIVDILKLSSSMYWLGLDNNWWDLMGDAPIVLKLRGIAEEHPARAPSVWCLVLLHKYYQDHGWDLPEGRTLIKVSPLDKLYIPRDHGRHHKELRTLFQHRFIPHKFQPKLYFGRGIWENFARKAHSLSKMNHIEFVRSKAFRGSEYFHVIGSRVVFGEAPCKQDVCKTTALRLEQLGTLHVRRCNTLVCFYKNKRYAIEYFKNQVDVEDSIKMDATLYKIFGPVHIRQSRLVRMEGCIRNNKYEAGIYYAKIYEDFPIAMPISRGFWKWKKSIINHTALVVSLAKYCVGCGPLSSSQLYLYFDDGDTMERYLLPHVASIGHCTDWDTEWPGKLGSLDSVLCDHKKDVKDFLDYLIAKFKLERAKEMKDLLYPTEDK